MKGEVFIGKTDAKKYTAITDVVYEGKTPMVLLINETDDLLYIALSELENVFTGNFYIR